MDDVRTLFEFYICTITSDTNMKMKYCDVFRPEYKKALQRYFLTYQTRNVLSVYRILFLVTWFSNYEFLTLD